jgi:hypothetical protein
MIRQAIFAAAFASTMACRIMAQQPGSMAEAHQSAADESMSQPDRYGSQTDMEHASRIELWNSPEMLDARKYVLEYSERSAQSSRAKGELYLERVSRLSSTAMKQWLQKLQQSRGEMQRQHEIGEAERQLLVDQAVQKNSQSQQAGFNAQQAKQWIADYWELMVNSEQEELEAPLNIKAKYAAALEAQLMQFDPFAPATDPVSPDALTRYKAAAALPGDLPRGDPANFSTGEAAGGGTAVPAGSPAAPGGE